MINSRTQSLDGKTVNELNKGFLLCAEYFESSQFMNAEQHTSLIHNAVPASFNVPNPPKCLASTRCDPTATASVPVKKARIQTTK